MIHYYILPLKESLPFRFLDVQKSVNDRLQQVPSCKNTEFELKLWDTYEWCPMTLELNAHFLWRGPEVEMLRIYFKKNNSNILSLEMDCDFLSYHIDIEDIAIDSQILNEHQASMLQKDGYYFWRFSVQDDEVQNIYLEILITALLDLTNGMVFSCKENWEMVLPPSFKLKASN